MTSDTGQDHEHLFLADFYPELGEYLAAQCATRYDARTGRARFHAWLLAHAGQTPIAEAGEAGAVPPEALVPGNDDDLPTAQVQVTGATADPVKDYLRQIGKIPQLNAEQEVELAKRIKAGLSAEEKLAGGNRRSDEQRLDLERITGDGQRAKNHLLEANLRLVVSLAKRYTGRGMLFLDLIQEGNLGLIRAVETFDYTKGYRFSTYATWWIRQAITRATAGPGGGPGDLVEDPEVSQPAEAVSFTLLHEQLHSVLDTLSEREAGIISMRFGLTDGQPKTLDEIGKVYGVTRDRIQQIESQTMSKLRRRGHGIGDEGHGGTGRPHKP